MENEWKSHLGGTIRVGESNEYDLVRQGVDDDSIVAKIPMQKGFHEEVGVNGFTVEDVIDIAIHRIEVLNGFLESEDNLSAIVALRNAKLHLSNRERKRAKAGVFGTNEPLPEKPKVAKIQPSLPSFVFGDKDK